MINQDIVNTIKEHYSRDIRKGLVKSILQNEKSGNKEALESSYKIINQIFSYVLSELNWNMAQNSDNWDDTPLGIISDAFPKIETTKWFQEQQLHVTKSINIEGNID